MIKFISHSEKETKKFAKKFAFNLKGGEILALWGALGSGKTTFVKGLARGLGIIQKITSPTFVIARPHVFGKRASKTFFHFDLYRLKFVRELEELGIREILQNPLNIVALEWAEKAKKFLPARTINLHFAFGRGPNARIISIWSKK